jgi:hypothetical protein
LVSKSRLAPLPVSPHSGRVLLFTSALFALRECDTTERERRRRRTFVVVFFVSAALILDFSNSFWIYVK